MERRRRKRKQARLALPRWRGTGRAACATRRGRLTRRAGRSPRGLAAVAVALAVAAAAPARALVTVSDPNDPSPFFRLFRPTGKIDETALSGFEFLISSRTGEFRANDQYLISGEVTDPTTSLVADLGTVSDLSGVPFDFAIEHHLAGGRNFTFRLTNRLTSATSVLCWGQNCEPGSVAAPILNGVAPILDYNGLQIQVRAQGVAGASAAVTITSLAGVTVAGAPFFDEVVTPSSPGTIPGDSGRRGQWLIGDSLDLVLNEWQLAGTVTLFRPDAALTNLTQVRLAVDLVRDVTQPFVVPEPGTGPLLGWGLVALGLAGLRLRPRRFLP